MEMSLANDRRDLSRFPQVIRGSSLLNFRAASVIAIGMGALAVASCSPAGAADDAKSFTGKIVDGIHSGLVNVHCVGQTFVRSPATGDTIVKPLTVDYAIDEPNQRVLQYSEERQVMEPAGSGAECHTTISNKSADIECAAAQTLPSDGTEKVWAHTRLDRVLGKLTADITIRKTYRENWRNSERSMSARADCSPGTDPTTIRKF